MPPLSPESAASAATPGGGIIDGESSQSLPVVIAGGGVAGLVLALSLHSRLGIVPAVYEQASGFVDGVGGAVGMYANGLRVVRDVDDDGKVLGKLRDAGYEYLWRRWYDHEGNEVCKAEERHLVGDNEDESGGDGEEEKELYSIGIRRWKLQRILYDACLERGIPIHFRRRVETVKELNDSAVEITFTNSDETVRTSLLFGCDGVLGAKASLEQQPEYTGVTCLMGASPVPSPVRGICFPSSNTTKCHMCTYPTGPNETIFQMYFPTPVENPEAWGALGEEGGRRERDELAAKMREHGWCERFVNTVAEADPSSVVRVGLRAREPLSRWVRGNVVLLGDAAHPPVPYIGQGAMMAVEDAGVLALLLQKMCCSPSSDGSGQGKSPIANFDLKSLPAALNLYQTLRIPRTASVLGKSKSLGKTQQDRAESRPYEVWRGLSMKVQVAWHGTLPVLKAGPHYDYRRGVEEGLKVMQQVGEEAEEEADCRGLVLGCMGTKAPIENKDALDTVAASA